MTDPVYATLPNGCSIRLTPVHGGQVLGEVWFPFGRGSGSTLAPDEAQARTRLEEIARDHLEGRK